MTRGGQCAFVAGSSTPRRPAHGDSMDGDYCQPREKFQSQAEWSSDLVLFFIPTLLPSPSPLRHFLPLLFPFAVSPLLPLFCLLCSSCSCPDLLSECPPFGRGEQGSPSLNTQTHLRRATCPHRVEVHRTPRTPSSTSRCLSGTRCPPSSHTLRGKLLYCGRLNCSKHS